MEHSVRTNVEQTVLHSAIVGYVRVGLQEISWIASVGDSWRFFCHGFVVGTVDDLFLFFSFFFFGKSVRT